MRAHPFFESLKKIPPLKIKIFFGFVCTGLVLLLAVFKGEFGSFLPDNLMYDRILRMNWHPLPDKGPKVTIIDIDDASIQAEGPWPWPRSKVAELIEILKRSGAQTVSLDIVMSEASGNYALQLKTQLEAVLHEQVNDPSIQNFFSALHQVAPIVDNDKIFYQTLLKEGPVLGFLFHYISNIQKSSLPPPLKDSHGQAISAEGLDLTSFSGYNGIFSLFMTPKTKAGFVTANPDVDGIVRHANLIAQFDHHIYPSLGFATAMDYMKVKQIKLLKTQTFGQEQLYGIQLDRRVIPTDAHGRMLIPFWGEAGTLNYYSATDVLHGQVNPEALKGGVALIGSTLALLADLHPSPLAPLFPGVEMVGNLIQAIIANEIPLRYDWNHIPGLIVLFVIGAIFALALPLMSINVMLLATFLVFVIILTVSLFSFVFWNVFIPTALLLLLLLLQTMVNYIYSFILERQQKLKIRQLFGQYVPEDYVKALIEVPDHSSMAGETRCMTVLFSDIRDFTTLSESLDAAGVKRLLNRFFTPLTKIIFDYHGTIDKYVGDMIMAFWGAPLEDKNHIGHAIEASLTIFQQLPMINQQLTQDGLPALKIGIGLASGMMNVGDMGSEFRRAYTVLGDTVNLASRLQDLTRFYKVNILVNEDLRIGQDKYAWRIIDKVMVKGRHTAVTIYQPIDFVSNISEEQSQELDSYHAALQHYYQQAWPQAEQLFNELCQKSKKYYLYQLYLERIQIFKQQPPTKDWNGVFIHTKKYSA